MWNDRLKLWLAGLKPPMYSVAIMPIVVGSAIAKSEQEFSSAPVLAVFLVSAVLILVWENLCNDVFDSETGIDQHKYHSLVNLTGKRGLVQTIANFCLLGGWGGIAWICWQMGDAVVGGLVLLCCGLGYVYQAPPWRLGYQGWGELLCFVSFGPLAVSAAHYSQAQSFSAPVVWASIPTGLSIGLVLFCSHFHQVQDDLKAGKRSPVVRLGTEQSARLVPIICALIYGCLGMGVAIDQLPLKALLAMVSLPWAIQLSRLLLAHHSTPELISHSKFIALKFQFAYCMGLSLGFWL